MSLTNSQYNQIMRTYSQTRFQHQHELNERLDRIYARCPRLKELSSDIPSASAALARAQLSQDEAAISRAAAGLALLRGERDRLLSSIGCSPADIQLQYTCPDCRDTGYINNNEKCRCLRQAGINLLFEQSGLREVLQKENFKTFDLSLYSDEPNPLLNGKSNRTHMKEIRNKCLRYANQFQPGSPSLLFFGDPGVGKTFLTNCIAQKVLENGYSVLYQTAAELFESASARFRQEDAESDTCGYVFDCDLLIIDDLGTEHYSSFKASHLFHVINSRWIAKKSTIISTNLLPEEIEKIYTERISSRLMGNFTIVPILGEDIRTIRKRL